MRKPGWRQRRSRGAAVLIVSGVILSLLLPAAAAWLLGERHTAWPRQSAVTWVAAGFIAIVLGTGAAHLARQASRREFSEAALVTTLDHLSQGVLMIDGERRVRTYNRRLIEMLDIPPSFIAGRPSLEDIVSFQCARGEFGPDGADMDPRIPPIVRAAGTPDRKITYERRRPDGTILEITVNPLPDGGEVRTYADVTAARNRENALESALQGRIEAETALQKRRDDLIQELAERADRPPAEAPGMKEWSEAACDWIWETDDTLRITFLSKRFGETSGLSWEDANGARFTDLVAFGFDAAGMDDLVAIFASRETFHNLTRRVMCAGNDRRFWRISGKPIFDAATGAFAGYRGTGTDVTSMLEYEAEMKSALIRARDAEQIAREASTRLVDAIETIPEGIVLFDADDRIVMCNAGYKRLYPLTADLTVPGTRFEDLLRASVERGQHVLSGQDTEEWLRQRLARHAAPDGNREENRLVGGRWIQTQDRPMRDGGVVGIRVDVTEARQMEANERAREYLDAEMKAARAIQIGLLPSERFQRDVMAASGLDIAGRSACCSELGGDLWGLAALDHAKVGFYIVDFAGHGTTAALNTFRLHTLIHELQAALPDPAQLLTELNIRLTELLPVGTFATMLYCVVDLHSDCLIYAAAGAPPPFVKCGADRPLMPIDSCGVPLGVDAEAVYASSSVPFGPGGVIVIYSDMLTDFVDDEGNRAEESAAFKLVQDCVTAPTAEAIVERICEPFLGAAAVPLTDDLTVLCVARPLRQEH